MNTLTEEQKRKLQDIFADYNATIKTYVTMDALHKMAEHWVENEVIIERAAVDEAEKNGPKWTPDCNDKDSIGEFLAERDMARHWHDNVMIPTHRYSSVVMLFVTIERELRRLTENLEKEYGPQKLQVKDIKANSYMAQVGKYIEVFHGVKFPDCPQYEALSDLQKIRDCIIHCRGEVSLSRDKDYLVNLWRGDKRRRGFAAPANDDVHIDIQCIKQFLIEIWSFFVWVFKSLNWKISARWQGDKLEKIFERLNG